jgi:hypothetical protein
MDNDIKLKKEAESRITESKKTLVENKPIDDFLDKVEGKVYSRAREAFTDSRHKVENKDRSKYIWDPKFDTGKKIELDIDTKPAERGFSYLSLGIFFSSLVLFLGAILYAVYSFTLGGYVVQQDKIDVELSMPNYTNAGQDLTGQIMIGNRNRTAFKDSYIAATKCYPNRRGRPRCWW